MKKTWENFSKKSKSKKVSCKLLVKTKVRSNGIIFFTMPSQLYEEDSIWNSLADGTI